MEGPLTGGDSHVMEEAPDAAALLPGRLRV